MFVNDSVTNFPKWNCTTISERTYHSHKTFFFFYTKIKREILIAIQYSWNILKIISACLFTSVVVVDADVFTHTRFPSSSHIFHARFFLLLSHCSHGIQFHSHAANTRRTNSHTWLHSIDPPEQPATSNAYNMCVACCANSSRIITKFN